MTSETYYCKRRPGWESVVDYSIGISERRSARKIEELKLDTSNDPMTCPRCDQCLAFVGTKSFHEGRRYGLLGDIGELFVNKERFDVYVCNRCGRVELFVDGIGEEFRPQ